MVSYSLEHACCHFSHSVIGLLTCDDCSFRYTPTLFYIQSLPAKLQSFLTPLAIVVSVWTDHFKKPSVTVDSTVLPRTHFVGNSLGYFSTYIYMYLFIHVASVKFPCVVKYLKKIFSIDPHWLRIFNRKKFCLFGKVSHLSVERLSHLVVEFK